MVSKAIALAMLPAALKWLKGADSVAIARDAAAELRAMIPEAGDVAAVAGLLRAIAGELEARS